MKWISSNGGPLVAVPEVVLPAWLGADDDEQDGVEGDYDRASDVEDYAGFVTVAGKQVLVLGDDPAPTAYYGDRSVLVRRLAAQGESVAPGVVDDAIASASWESVGEWDVPGRVVLFDAAFAAADIAATSSLAIDLTSGSYEVATAYVEPDPETWLVLVRLSPIDG